MKLWPTDTIHSQVWDHSLRAHPHPGTVGQDAGKLARHVAGLSPGETPLGGLGGRPWGSLWLGDGPGAGRPVPDLPERAEVVREVRSHRPPVAPGQPYVGIVMSRLELS